jgi:hypothetical protein
MSKTGFTPSLWLAKVIRDNKTRLAAFERRTSHSRPADKPPAVDWDYSERETRRTLESDERAAAFSAPVSQSERQEKVKALVGLAIRGPSAQNIDLAAGELKTLEGRPPIPNQKSRKEVPMKDDKTRQIEAGKRLARGIAPAAANRAAERDRREWRSQIKDANRASGKYDQLVRIELARMKTNNPTAKYSDAERVVRAQRPDLIRLQTMKKGG